MMPTLLPTSLLSDATATFLSTLAELPLLAILITTPLTGALLIALLPVRHDALVRRVSLLTHLLTLLIAVLVLLAFAPGQSGFQFVRSTPWLPTLGSHLLVGVDALSVVFLAIVPLLFLGAVVDGWNTAATRHGSARLFHVLLLILLALTLAIFCALDSLFFFALWEASMLPLFFLIARFSSDPHARQSAMQYVMLMLGSGGLLLLAFLLAGAMQGHFDLSRDSTLSPGQQKFIFVLILGGLAAKLPIVPLHTWLPRLALAGPAGIVATFGGLKLAAYALLRLSDSLTPEAARELHWLLAGLGTVGILYGALGAIAQSNLRTVLAYTGISHVGLVLLGIASFDQTGRQGALLVLLALPLTTGGLYLLAAFLQRRTGTTDLHALSGITHSAPRLTAIFLALALASVGLPGFALFPGELMVFGSAIKVHTGAALAALFGAGVGVAALLSAFRKVFHGPEGAHGPVPDLLPRELALMLVFLGAALGLGLLPGVVLGL